jgi:hypothetical protein
MSILRSSFTGNGSFCHPNKVENHESPVLQKIHRCKEENVFFRDENWL